MAETLDNFGLPAKAIGGAYEGASRTSREIALWAPPIRSADDDLNSDKPVADARARDLARNEGFVHGSVHFAQDSIVGARFLLNAKPDTTILRAYNKAFDDKWEEEFQEVVEARFTAFGESPANWIDVARQNTFTELVRLAVGIHTYAGEVIATAEWLRDAARPYHTAIQMVDVDRVCNPNHMPDTRTLRRGVEKDRNGAPIAYHFLMGHPNEHYDHLSMRWRRVPVRKPWGRIQVIHIFEQQRPDQSRGVADIVAALKEMKMTKKFSDVTLQSAVLNATYAATIESELPPAEAYAMLGEGGAEEWAANYLAAIAEYTGASKNIHIDGVKIPHLYPGTKLNLRAAGTPGGIGTAFEESLLRRVAAALGVSYEEFSRDFTKTNYSSARAAMLQTWRRMQTRKQAVADKFGAHIYALVLEEMINRREVPLPVGVGPEVFYEGLNKEALCACDFVGASRGQIDELKETEAAVMRIEKGLSTYEDESARLGKDFRALFKQRAREQQMLRDLNLDFSATTVAVSGKKEEIDDDQ